MTTIKEVAEMAGVSVATVSHVVRKTRYVSPELERKVEEVIASLDSVPNFVLKQNKKNENKVQILLVYF
ncbi:LacI family DNA-binding transcriptional regulator [Enterococcus sp. S181_ASV_20]|nr:LacI family DNA-binding transcriptional regulator [Enterococcus sp. S181_ASV_20]